MFERKKPSGKLLSLPIDQIHPSPFQARKSFDEQELTALAQSIRENGLLQPVTVRKAAEGYELVAGERRLRACQLAKMTTIPAILCSYADDRTAALGLLAGCSSSSTAASSGSTAAAEDKYTPGTYSASKTISYSEIGVSMTFDANSITCLLYTSDAADE